MKTLLPILIAVFIAATGYGVSFPLLGLQVERVAASGWMLGMNAAMPALGWVVGSLLVPVLQLRLRIPIGVLAVAFLVCAGLAATGLRYADAFLDMTVLRFFFGGGMGLFFRSVEYWINGLSPDHVRGRNLAINGIAFMGGLVVGSAAQPALGAEGWVPFGFVLAAIVLAAFGTAFWPKLALPSAITPSFSAAWACVAAIPAAYAAGLAYGLYESVPAYLNQIYALRNGLEADVAAYALTAAALGNILIPLPVAMLSDRIGRRAPLIACACVTGVVALFVPKTLATPYLFLFAVMVCAGSAGTVYGLGLALIGDRFRGADLVTANAGFGLVYAAASIAGPLINGSALDALNTHGLVVSSALIFGCLVTFLVVFGPGAFARKG